MMNNSVIINTCDWGSTGKIAKGLQQYLKRHNNFALFCYGRGEKRDDDDCYRFCTKLEVVSHYLDNRITGRLNGSSVISTRRLISRLQKLKVKEVYIVNLHGYVLNEKLFLEYLVSNDIHVVYIMADESAFLGNCTYRTGCEYYKNRCNPCLKAKGVAKYLCPNIPQKAYDIKNNAYRELQHITFVGPEYVIQEAKTSPLLNGKRLEILDEAIDVCVNIPRETSSLRNELGISEKQIVIGCVAPLSFPRKGVKYFIEAAKKLENDNRFVFVHVGYDKKDKSGLPSNYIPIGYVNNQEQLTNFYSLSDLFVFPSSHDTMPNTCLEALACGSPLLCFNISGMPYLADETVMTLVEPMNVEQMVRVILQTKKKDETVINTCRNYALKRFDNENYNERLVEIMNSMNN